MKQGNSRRSRSRGGGKRHGGGGKGHNFESNGPEVKIRGTAQQLHDKYLALARDATSAGDRIAAESFFQYADHYHRVLNVDGGNGAGRNQPQHHQHPQHRGGNDQRHDPRQGGQPQHGQPQQAVTAAAVAAQAQPATKEPDAAKTPNPTNRGQGPVAS